MEGKTNGRIVDLIPAGSIDSQTRLVLANAIFFKAAWAKTFKTQDTQKGDFTNLRGRKQSADFMSVKGEFVYAEDQQLKAQLIELPYTSSQEASLLIALPKEQKGLRKMESNLGAVLRAFSSMNRQTSTNVQVYFFSTENY